MPTVATAHSPNKTLSIETICSLVREALDQIGGFEAFVKPGQRVLLKPDQNCSRLAEEGSTTDPLLVGALIRLAWEAGAASVQVAASSDDVHSALECMRFTGMASVVEQEGAELLDLRDAEVADREVYLPEGRVLTKARVPVPLLDCDAIIAVPKARTDARDVVAASLEFCLGSLYQYRSGYEGTRQDLIEHLADVMTVVRADLWITDALICGEGDGPHANTPHWCGCILASSDPVATDHAIARLLGRDPLQLRFANALEVRGVGYSAPVTYLGVHLERFAFNAWSAHHGFDHLLANVLVGSGVTEEGTVWHIKQALEKATSEGLLQQVCHDSGTPTVLIGAAEDSDFEEHVQQGPYIVCGDVAPAKYREDARTSFVPGFPVDSKATEAIRRILRKHEVTSNSASRHALVPHEPFDNRILAAALACAGIGLMLCLQSAESVR